MIHRYGFCSVSFRFWVFWVMFRFRNFSVSKLFHFLDGFGFGIEKIWYRKKYRIRYRKYLVSEKVSDSVSEKFGIGKKFRIRFRSDFGYRHTLVLRTPDFWKLNITSPALLRPVSCSPYQFENSHLGRCVITWKLWAIQKWLKWHHSRHLSTQLLSDGKQFSCKSLRPCR